MSDERGGRWVRLQERAHSLLTSFSCLPPSLFLPPSLPSSRYEGFWRENKPHGKGTFWRNLTSGCDLSSLKDPTGPSPAAIAAATIAMGGSVGSVASLAAAEAAASSSKQKSSSGHGSTGALSASGLRKPPVGHLIKLYEGEFMDGKREGRGRLFIYHAASAAAPVDV